jgi:hypothetical protein
MPVSTAESLHTVLQAVTQVAANLTDTGEHPYTLKKVTSSGKACFRFTTFVTVNGQSVEVQIRTTGA